MARAEEALSTVSVKAAWDLVWEGGANKTSRLEGQLEGLLTQVYWGCANGASAPSHPILCILCMTVTREDHFQILGGFISTRSAWPLASLQGNSVCSSHEGC